MASGYMKSDGPNKRSLSMKGNKNAHSEKDKVSSAHKKELKTQETGQVRATKYSRSSPLGEYHHHTKTDFGTLHSYINGSGEIEHSWQGE